MKITTNSIALYANFMLARVLKGIKSSALNSLQIIKAYVEPSLLQVKADDKSQFERHSYVVADRVDLGTGKVVLNKITELQLT
jgi:tRNA synthetases class I (E and Q), anti-codon binding domain